MIILDLETSGLEAKKDKIIEFAAVKIDENLNEIERLNFFVNPESEVSNEVLKLTGIKQEILDKSPTFQEKIPEIEKFLEGDRTIIGHNISFDIGFLQEWGFLKKNNFLDTFILSSIFFEKQDSYALEVLSDKFKIEHEFKHRAIGDVLANLDLLRKIVGKIKTTNSDFFNLISEKGIKGKYSNFIFDVKSLLIGEKIDDFCDENNFKKEEKKLEKNGNILEKEIFEFSTKENLFKKIEEFFHQEEKNLVIIPNFLRNILFEKYENFPEIKIIYGKKFHGSEKKFFDLISDKEKFSHIKNNEIREFFELKILLAISKKLELNLKNIHISYDEYELWSKIVDNERGISIGEKNLIEFKDFAENKENFSELKKLFIEPEIFFEDKSNFVSLNYLIKNLPENEKNILEEKFSELKNYFLPENFEKLSEDEKNKINEKNFGKYGLTIEINKEKILEGDWGFFQNFENSLENSENLAFSTEGRKKTEEKGKKFLFELKNFGEELKKILGDNENFSSMKKNLEKFLSSENSKNFYKFIKISENNISLSAQKIDLVSEFKEDFQDSSFGFFGGGLKILENGKTSNEKNFNFMKKIYGLNSLNNSINYKETFEDKKINYFYPTDPYAPGSKNKDFGNFLLNQISEICSERHYNQENNKKENIGIAVNNKKDLEKIYKNLLENYPDMEIFAEGLSGGKNKIIHKIKESDKFILIAQQNFFEKLFTDSEKNIDYLIFTKFPFDPPNGVFKLREEFYNGNFKNYSLPKSLLKTKEIILLSGTESVFFCDKKVGSDAWAKNYCNL